MKTLSETLSKASKVTESLDEVSDKGQIPHFGTGSSHQPPSFVQAKEH